MLMMHFSSATKLSYTQFRHISSLFYRPRPRSYKRRLYEATVAPILPKKLENEWKSLNDPHNINAVSPPYTELKENELSQYDLALVEKTRNWIREEGFRVMAICHLNYVKEDTFWLSKNQFRLNEIEFCYLPCKILKRLFEGSPFHVIRHLFINDCTCLLFGHNVESIGTMISQCNRFSWILPIAMTLDDRIMTMDQAKELANPDSLDKLRMETIQILRLLIMQVPNSLESIATKIPHTLDIHLNSHNHIG